MWCSSLRSIRTPTREPKAELVEKMGRLALIPVYARAISSTFTENTVFYDFLLRVNLAILIPLDHLQKLWNLASESMTRLSILRHLHGFSRRAASALS